MRGRASPYATPAARSRVRNTQVASGSRPVQTSSPKSVRHAPATSPKPSPSAPRRSGSRRSTAQLLAPTIFATALVRLVAALSSCFAHVAPALVRQVGIVVLGLDAGEGGVGAAVEGFLLSREDLGAGFCDHLLAGDRGLRRAWRVARCGSAAAANERSRRHGAACATRRRLRSCVRAFELRSCDARIASLLAGVASDGRADSCRRAPRRRARRHARTRP